jgi:hypothetical protein
MQTGALIYFVRYPELQATLSLEVAVQIEGHRFLKEATRIQDRDEFT